MKNRPTISEAFVAFDHEHGCWIGRDARALAQVMQDELRRSKVETSLEKSGAEYRLFCKRLGEYFWPEATLPLAAEIERLSR